MDRIGGIDSTYQALIAGLPRELREAAKGLPCRLGLVPNADGGWEDFVALEPNRDLPAFAAEDPDRPSELLISQERLDRFRAAHHLGVVHGLLWCTLARDTVAADPRLVMLRRAVRRGWEEALVRAAGGGDLARAMARGCIARSLRATRRGIVLEREVIARGTLDATGYAELCGAMTGWLGVTAQAMVLWLGGSERASQLRHSYERLLLAVRCLDDAFKGLEEGANGAPSPRPRLPPGELLAAAPRLARQASKSARLGGFHRFAAWLDNFACTVDGMNPAKVTGSSADLDWGPLASTVGSA